MIDEKAETPLLNLPNRWLNFDGNFLASCAFANQNALMDLCHDYIRHWFVHQYSVHEFAKRMQEENISLWTARDVNMSAPDLPENAFAFYMRFDGTDEPQKNYVLIQCQIQRCETLQ